MEIGVLFADVRGFTTLSERMAPDDVAELLNRFYAAASKVLAARRSSTSSWATRSWPCTSPCCSSDRWEDHLVRDANDLLAAVGFATGEEPWLPLGVGLDLGRAYVGNVGAGDVKDFTALGDVVNTAARLQSSAAAGQIVVSERLFGRLSSAVAGARRPASALQGKRSRSRPGWSTSRRLTVRSPRSGRRRGSAPRGLPSLPGPRPVTSARPHRPGTPESVTVPNSRRQVRRRSAGPSGVGSRPSTVVSSSSGAPAAQACGLDAVGYSTGAWVSRSSIAGEHLRQPVLEEAGRLARAPAAIRAAASSVAVAGQAGGDQRVVVRPDRAVVVLDRVVAAPRSSASVRTPQPENSASPIRCADDGLGARRRRRSRSTAGGRCSRSGCRPAACRRRARARSTRARAARSPRSKRARSAAASASSRSASAGSSQTSRASRARAALGVVGVALDLAGRDGPAREARRRRTAIEFQESFQHWLTRPVCGLRVWYST